MTEVHFDGKVALKALLLKPCNIANDPEVLVCRDAKDTDIWELPGGRLNQNEHLPYALQRELDEELNAAVEVGPLVYSEQYLHVREGKFALLLAFEVRMLHPTLRFKLSPEVAEVRWVTYKDVIEGAIKMYPNCASAVLKFLDPQHAPMWRFR